MALAVPIKWNSLRKELKTSEGISGQALIEINESRTQIRKIFYKEEYKCYENEKRILSSLKHPNIIELLNADDNKHALYFKYYSRGTAFKKYIKNNQIEITDLNILIKLFDDLLDALIYLHNNCITHRDIKLENILINNDDEHILCDFGLARHSLIKMRKICGTYNYMAPEMWFLNKKNNDKYDYKVDIFSLGALMIELVNGESAFYDEYRCRFKRVYKELNKYMDEEKENKIFSHIWYSNNKWISFKDLIKKMIEPDPAKRIDYEIIRITFNEIKKLDTKRK